MKKLILLIVLLISTPLLAKQYDVPVYYKVRYADGIECKQFFSYHSGKEHYINTICIN